MVEQTPNQGNGTALRIPNVQSRFLLALPGVGCGRGTPHIGLYCLIGSRLADHALYSQLILTMVFFFKTATQPSFVPRFVRVSMEYSDGIRQINWSGGMIQIWKWWFYWMPNNPMFREEVPCIMASGKKSRACYRVIHYSLGGKEIASTGVVDMLDEETKYTDDVNEDRAIQLGQVNSAMTGNKPNFAHAGGNITQINYYGTDHTQAYNPTQQTMDPGQFTKPIADVAASMAGPTLKSPTVEEMGYSDRLMQLTAGQTCITTQEAATAIVAYGQWPRELKNTGEAVDKPTRPGPACDRFYTLDSFYWTKSSNSWALPLPGAMSDTGIFGQNLRFHYLYRSGFCVHVQVNASKFHQGALLVAMVPEFQQPKPLSDGVNVDPTLFEKSYPTAQMTLFPHQIVNLRTNNAATIIYPFTNPTPSAFGLTHNFVTLFIKVIVPLNYNTGATPSVPITISIAPMESQFSGLRNSITAQGFPVWQLPGSRQFCTTVRNAGIPIYPNFSKTDSFKNPGRVRNLLEVAQCGTFATVSSDTSSAFALNIDVSAPSVNNGVAAPIAVWDMSLNANFMRSTYVSMLSQFYTQYRGALKLHFMFCGSQMATGRILIAYTPPGGSAPQTRKEAMLGTHAIWDIGLQSTLSFTVPFISASQFRNQNQQNSILSYDGYITVWYQTQVVVPPGAPSTCQIMVLASAASDFCFRIPSDSAYFQGLGDDLQGFIKDSIANALESATTTKAIENPKGLEDGLAIKEGEAPALTAAETGTTDTNPGEGQMELRDYNNQYSTEETDLEYMMSRYFVYTAFNIGFTQGAGTGTQGNYTMFKSFIVDFNKIVATSTAARSKWNSMTYWRFDVDFVFVFSSLQNGTSYSNPTFQVMFCPVGSTVPSLVDSSLWDNPTNPSVYVRLNDPPSSFRVPFMSPANYYAAWFDGYSNFSKDTNSVYGQFPGNQIGTIAIRYLTNPYNSTTNHCVNVKVLCRPINIEACMPRPLASYKQNPTTAAQPRGRTVYTDSATIRLGPPMHLKKMAIWSTPEWSDSSADMFVDDLFTRFSIPFVGENGDFTAWMWNKDWCVVSAHAFNDWRFATKFGPGFLRFKTGHDKWMFTPPIQDYVTEYSVIEHMDLCFFKCSLTFKKGIRDFCYRSYTYHDTHTNIVVNSGHFPMQYQVTGGYHYRPNIRSENNKIQVDLIGVDFDGERGFCGGLLVDPTGKKVLGMITAKCMTGYGDTLGLKRWVTYSTMLLKTTRKEPPAPHNGGEACIQLGPVYQGIKDTILSAFGSAGSALGDGFGEQLEERLSAVADRVESKLVRAQHVLDNKFVMSSFKAVVKVISALIILLNTPEWNRLSTGFALVALVGVDFLDRDPFQWLREQIWPNEYIVEEQGFTDWMKDFNAACTAAKGLEWICDKFMQFIEWCKKVFKKSKEDEKRKAFLDILKCWPDMMKAWDEMETTRKGTDTERRELAEVILKMKQSADVYGVERNFATCQIVKYAARASKYLQGLSKTRFEPVTVCIHGSPGTGKSLATALIGKAVAMKTDGKAPYSLPPDPKYFDGYTGQNVVIMDDLGQNPDGEDMSLFCQMVSTVPFIPPMASLEDKGVPFLSEFVLASTNQLELKPPTVAEPQAIKRRFHLDLDILVADDYIKAGSDLSKPQLDVAKCKTCAHPPQVLPVYFKKCNPLVCGEAIRLKDRKTGNVYTVDDVVGEILRERKDRSSVLNIVDGLFQGGVDKKDVEFAERIVRPKEVKKVDRVLPEDVAKILEFHTDEVLINKLVDEGYIIPQKVTYERERKKVMDYINMCANVLAAVAVLASSGALIYFLIKAFAGSQGPYEGAAKKTLKKPERRVVEVQGPDNEFINRLYKSSIFQVVTTRGPFTGLGLYDNWMVLPRHSEPGEIITISKKVYKVLDVVVLESTKGNLELVMVQIDRTEKFRDIRKFIPSSITMHKDAWLVMDSEQFPRTLIPVGTVTPFGFLNLSMRATYNTLTYAYPTKSGQCGGVVVKAGAIIGMHIGGDGANGYAAAFKSSYFSGIQGVIKSVERAPKPVNVKSSTSLFPSVFHDVFSGTKEPAVLSKNDPRLEVDLNDAMFSKYKGNVDVSIPPETFVAIDHYVEQIRPLMPPDLTEPLPLEDVVYGIQNLEGLDLNTSAGFPYNTMGIKKKDLIPERGEPLDKLVDALDLHGYGLPYTIYMKDELRPLEKIKKGKTRLIHCSSVNDTIRTKRIFGRFFQTFHQNPGTVTGSAVGCDPDIHWSRFAVELGWENVCAFDYSNWDGSLSPFWFDALKIFFLKLGYSEKDIVVIDHLYKNKQIFKNDLITVEGAMPSGCSGTSIFNSVINNIVVRTLVLQAYKGVDLDQLRILCYGDDLLVTYPYPLDPSVLADFGKKLGLFMTPADKSDAFDGCKSLSEVTFLKRSFVPDDEFPFLVHPVYDVKEAAESLRWTRCASTTQEHLRSILELVWHSGEDVYQDFVEKIRSVPIGKALVIPTYNYFRATWLDKF
uniref:Genome polyprotein n=1 Tax=Eidolon bat picornavirus TaxID=3141876 RepID=A0AAU7E278_9VIRU